MIAIGEVQLGLGLIGIGRPWGYRDAIVPSESEALQLLERAVRLGIRYLDTAASYGWSEERTGMFLRGLTNSERDRLTVATKFGETWDFDRTEPVVDHSFDGLRRSLDRSLEFLGRIDVLQLHKTSPAVLRSEELAKAWEYARSLGIQHLGASVSDVDSAALALSSQPYEMLQVPFHREALQFRDVLLLGNSTGKWIATNRPFGMGKHLYGDQPVDRTDAFRFVLTHLRRGVILTGTKSIRHLEQNCEAFTKAAPLH